MMIGLLVYREFLLKFGVLLLQVCFGAKENDR